MTTRKLLEYVHTQAEKFGWETHIEGTGPYNEDGIETHLWLSKSLDGEKYEMEFYYYIKLKNDGEDYSITNTPLTRSELGDDWVTKNYEYRTKEDIDEYFSSSGPSIQQFRDQLLNMFDN